MDDREKVARSELTEKCTKLFSGQGILKKKYSKILGLNFKLD